MAKSTEYFYGLGRRKSATATARIFNGGKGQITINNKPAAEYLSLSPGLIEELNDPFKVVSKDGQFDVTILVKGGGLSGQVDAIKLAISKALSELSDDYRSTLKKAGLIKRDSREKERNKPGLKRARRAEQFSKR
jgi:small subunit ribosomal protein S9